MKDPDIIIPKCPEFEKVLKNIPDEIIIKRLDNLFNKETENGGNQDDICNYGKISNR